MRACHTNNCPVGIATQKDHLRKRLKIEISAKQLYNFLTASIELMKILARGCGHDDLRSFSNNDLTTFNFELSKLSGVRFAGI